VVEKIPGAEFASSCDRGLFTVAGAVSRLKGHVLRIEQLCDCASDKRTALCVAPMELLADIVDTTKAVLVFFSREWTRAI
jgi:hypothetical protein